MTQKPEPLSAEKLRATADGALKLLGKERDRLRGRVASRDEVAEKALERLRTIHLLADAGSSWAKDSTRSRVRTLAREAIEALDLGDSDVCRWRVDDTGLWESECDEAWQFNDGGPKENRVRFCHGCGRLVRVAVGC